MKVIEKNEGRKIAYELNGTKLDFADGALTLNLARYQQDEAITKDIMVDSEGYLTTGRGRYYAAQVEIPAAEYEEHTETKTVTDADGNESTAETVTREKLPLDTDKVTLYLFSIAGINIC